MIDRVLVLDVGSTALKAAVFTADGEMLALSEAGLGPAPALHRQDPESWWSAARTAIAALGRPRVDAVVLTGTMENLIAVDRNGEPLGDAILYSDPCGGAALERSRGVLDDLGAAQILGNDPEPLMTAFKIGWLRDAHPDLFESAAFFLPGAKDFVALRLTGRAVTDPVTASTTGLMDMARRRWSETLATALGVPLRALPEILPTGAVIGPVLPDAASDLGLDSSADILVVNGCGDAGATTLGSFCRASGDISLYLGTTGWLARVVAEAEIEARRPVYRLAHPWPGNIIEITPILSAGAAAAWARATLSLTDAMAEQALAAADENPADILFLPYLSGERSPFMDADVRGAFLGLGAEHGPAALYYAVLEGVGHAIRANLDALDPSGAGRIRLVGGGARSATWPRMVADVLGRAISVPPSPLVATAMGAFLIAAKTFGLAGVDEAAMQTIAPRENRRARIERQAATFAEATSFARRLKPRRVAGEGS
ncbi:MAG: FGGY family carbohydrate kinase [Pseudomonadota bacterium]|nr:FGGY family carbohydrate kinase [Pseudomonadota bacterium]